MTEAARRLEQARRDLDDAVGFRNLYAVEPNTQTLTEKIDALRWFADEIIAKV